MPVISTMKMSARQFLQLGEDPPGVRLELIDGEIAVGPSPTPEHSYIDTEIRRRLGNHIKKHKLGLLFGDVDTLFGENDVRRPDVIFFSHKRSNLIGAGAMEGAPDLCVEIISPSSTTVDRVDKFQQYQAGGVLHYWMVDSRDKSIEGYKLSRGKYTLAGRGQGDNIISLPPFPDLKIPVAKLWLNISPRPPKRGQRRA